MFANPSWAIWRVPIFSTLQIGKLTLIQRMLFFPVGSTWNKTAILFYSPQFNLQLFEFGFYLIKSLSWMKNVANRSQLFIQHFMEIVDNLLFWSIFFILIEAIRSYLIHHIWIKSKSNLLTKVKDKLLLYSYSMRIKSYMYSQIIWNLQKLIPSFLASLISASNYFFIFISR